MFFFYLWRKGCLEFASVVLFICSAYNILWNSHMKVFKILWRWKLITASECNVPHLPQHNNCFEQLRRDSCLLFSLWPFHFVAPDSYFSRPVPLGFKRFRSHTLDLNIKCLNTQSLKHFALIKVTPTDFSHPASALASFKKPIGLLLCHWRYNMSADKYRPHLFSSLKISFQTWNFPLVWWL